MKSIKKNLIILLAIFTLPLTNFATNQGVETATNGEEAKSEIEQSAINLLAGWSMPYYFNKEHQVFLKANAVKNFKKHVNTVVVGSSHLQSISSEDVGNECINLSVGGGTFQDKLNAFGMLDYYGVTYDKVVMDVTLIEICNMNFEDNKKNPINSFGEYFLDILDKKEKKREPITDFNKYYDNKDNLDLKVKFKLEDADKNFFHYTKDLSTIYADFVYGERKNKNLEESKKFIETDRLCATIHINKKAKDIFTKLIKYLKDKNIEIYIMMVPKPPYLFDELVMSSYPIVTEMNYFLIELVDKYGVKVEGSYDPHFMGAVIDDYYDNYHLLPTSFKKYYKFN